MRAIPDLALIESLSEIGSGAFSAALRTSLSARLCFAASVVLQWFDHIRKTAGNTSDFWILSFLGLVIATNVGWEEYRIDEFT